MKMTFSQIYTIESTNFHNAWCGAIQNVLKQPQTKLTFGSKEYSKNALDSIQTIILTGTLSSQAIGQIENKQTHPQYKFGGKRLEEYCKEFTADAVNKWRNEKRDDEGHFDYLYAERMWEQMPIALETLETVIKTQVKSNFMQLTTWDEEVDGTYVTSSPCLQRIWWQWYEGNYIDLHFDWRSRDLFGAWQSNLIALVDMLNREIFKPMNCHIARIVDKNDSLHIYEYDLIDAMDVKPVATFHGY